MFVVRVIIKVLIFLIVIGLVMEWKAVLNFPGIVATTFRLAWRNIWRNRKRTGITLGAVVFSTVVLIITYALTEGMMKNSIENATNAYIGEAQVHHPEYREERSFYDIVPYPEKVLEYADRNGLAATARSFGYGLLAMEKKSSGALFTGVDPLKEAAAMRLMRPESIESGRPLSSEAAGEVVLGGKLAKSMNVKVGDVVSDENDRCAGKIIALVQGADGSIGDDCYRVVGILKSVGEEIDRSAVFMHIDDFNELFSVPEDRSFVHEIAFNSFGENSVEDVKALLAEEFPQPPARQWMGLEILKDRGDEYYEVITWKDLVPVMAKMMDSIGAFLIIFEMIFCIAAAMGVMNTLLMSTFERIREFGVLKAVGETPWGILRSVAAEAAVLGALGSVIGVAIGIPICVYLNYAGLDMSKVAGGSISMSGVMFDPVWRATLNFHTIAVSVAMIWICCVLSALYPAIIAARLDPVRAMRHR